MACGTPVVSTGCPSGPPEILDDGRYGLLVPVGDERALAEAIETTLDDPPAGNFLRKRAMEFSADLIAKEYLDVLFG